MTNEPERDFLEIMADSISVKHFAVTDVGPVGLQHGPIPRKNMYLPRDFQELGYTRRGAAESFVTQRPFSSAPLASRSIQ